jgi:hypothetical protein
LFFTRLALAGQAPTADDDDDDDANSSRNRERLSRVKTRGRDTMAWSTPRKPLPTPSPKPSLFVIAAGHPVELAAPAKGTPSVGYRRPTPQVRFQRGIFGCRFAISRFADSHIKKQVARAHPHNSLCFFARVTRFDRRYRGAPPCRPPPRPRTAQAHTPTSVGGCSPRQATPLS